MPAPRVILALSFDDGFRTDVAIARLLENYSLRATFFIVAGKVDSNSVWLSRGDLCWLAEYHEVASHTLTHPCLTELLDSMLSRELRDSKLILEKITGKKVMGFAYPYGIFNKHIKEYVKRTGYSYARSTSPYWIGECGKFVDVYSLRVALPLYPVKIIGSINDLAGKLHRVFLRALIDKCLEDVEDVTSIALNRGYLNSIDIAKAVIAIACELSIIRNRSYIVSLWGHSWEILSDKNLRTSFEDLLAFISSLDRYVKVVTLKELVEIIATGSIK